MKTSFILYALGIGLIVTGCATDYRAGRADARRALGQGDLQLESYGLPSKWARDYDQLLLQRYGIKTRTVALLR